MRLFLLIGLVMLSACASQGTTTSLSETPPEATTPLAAPQPSPPPSAPSSHEEAAMTPPPSSAPESSFVDMSIEEGKNALLFCATTKLLLLREDFEHCLFGHWLVGMTIAYGQSFVKTQVCLNPNMLNALSEDTKTAIVKELC